MVMMEGESIRHTWPLCEELFSKAEWPLRPRGWSGAVDETCPHAFTEEKQMPGMNWSFQEKCLSSVQAPVG